MMLNHKEIKKLFIVPTHCAMCRKLMPIVIKQGVHCQVCKKNYHVDCYRQLKDKSCDIEIFWQGNIAYTIGRRAKVHSHFWQLSRDHVYVYKSKELKKRLYAIPLKKIKVFLNDDVARVLHSDSKEYSIRCKFHMKISKRQHFHCGVKTGGNRVNADATDNFYEIFELVLNSKEKLMAPVSQQKKIDDDFIKTGLIGKGTYGKVMNGVCRNTGRCVAIKTFDSLRSHAHSALYQSEIALQLNLKHPGIVQLLALYRENRRVYFVMERLEMNLVDLILMQENRRLDEKQAKFIAFQVFNAVDFMHEKQIAHCDLKPDNILLYGCNSGLPVAKLCDFGHSKMIKDDSFRKSKVGTEHYNAPELHESRPFNRSVDIWSMGIILYASLAGVMPFSINESIREQMNDKDAFPEHLWCSISPQAIDLVKNNLLQVSYKRPKTWKILQHAWFTQDKELRENLKDLEERVGLRWLTNNRQRV